jgi:hypothetical protein
MVPAEERKEKESTFPAAGHGPGDGHNLNGVTTTQTDLDAPPDKIPPRQEDAGDDSQGDEFDPASTAKSTAPVNCCTALYTRCSSGIRSFFSSFVGVIVVASTIALIVACAILIALWYSTSKSTVSTLSNQMRGNIMGSMIAEIQQSLSVPLNVVNQLDLAMQLHNPALNQVSTPLMAAGFFSTLSLMLHSFPTVATMGCGASNGVNLGAQQPAHAVLQANISGGGVYTVALNNKVPLATTSGGSTVLPINSQNYFRSFTCTGMRKAVSHAMPLRQRLCAHR